MICEICKIFPSTEKCDNCEKNICSGCSTVFELITTKKIVVLCNNCKSTIQNLN